MVTTIRIVKMGSLFEEKKQITNSDYQRARKRKSFDKTNEYLCVNETYSDVVSRDAMAEFYYSIRGCLDHRTRTTSVSRTMSEFFFVYRKCLQWVYFRWSNGIKHFQGWKQQSIYFFMQKIVAMDKRKNSSCQTFEAKTIRSILTSTMN